MREKQERTCQAKQLPYRIMRKLQESWQQAACALAASGEREQSGYVKTGRDSVRLSCEKETHYIDQATTEEEV